MFTSWRRRVGRNRQVFVEGRRIPGIQRPETGRSDWLVSDQPLVTKCRMEPTVCVGGRSIRGQQRPVTGRLSCV